MTKTTNFKGVLTGIAAGVLLTLSNASLTFALPGITSSTSTIPTYKTQWGSSGSGNGQFSSPKGIATDSEGNVYVADYAPNARIQKFSSDGVFLTTWGSYGIGDGLFEGPMDVAIDSNDNVYIVTTGSMGTNHVQKFTSEGAFIASWAPSGSGDGQVFSPNGLAIDNNDNVYVVDTDNDRIVKFTADGTFVTKWGSTGTTGNGTFNTPTGIAVDDDGNVYVTDRASHIIQKFTSDGTYLLEFGGFGSGDGQLNQPYDVTTDGTGRVYVADFINNRIQIYNLDGIFIGTWGSFGTSNGQFDGPRHIATDDEGGVYVSDDGNVRVQKFILPQNIARFTAVGSSTDIELTLPEGRHITAIESISESVGDNNFAYPLGLINFTFESEVSASTEVTFSFETDLKPSDVTVRKYSPTTQTYTNIDDATITETTVNGNSGLQLVYNVTDGGILDEDSTANGIVVGLIGLATAEINPDDTSGGGTPNSNAPGAPDTGYGFSQPNSSSTLLGLGIGTLILSSLSLATRKLAKQ